MKYKKTAESFKEEGDTGTKVVISLAISPKSSPKIWLNPLKTYLQATRIWRMASNVIQLKT